MNAPTLQATDFQTRFAHAITQRAIQACFQPIVDAQTHRIVSVEVVPCWHDDMHGHVLARNFIPLAKQLGVFEEVGLQVWAHALTCLQGWHSHHQSLTLLANITQKQFHWHGFTTQLTSNLNRLGIARSCINLEIAEKVAIEGGQAAIGRLTALREAGFGVMIGEFGSGNATFSQLLGNPSTGIRIDASLTRRVQGKVGAELIEAIVKVAHASNLQTIAAGVEDAETAALLALLGVHRLQGRYFGEAMDRQAFENVLAQYRHAP
jgi:EAL domain-containing protein (putative c-di-GMP-specific phosphodiesterase class I)